MSDNNKHKLNGNSINLSGKSLLQQQHQQQQNHPQQQHLSIQTAATVHKQHSSGRNQLQQQQQPVPPRYQPPPQPPGGILKNIPTLVGKSSSSDIHHHTRDINNIPHLNIKYPPEIPKLTTVYIPDTVKNISGSNSTRYSQRHRISDYSVNQNQDDFLLRQQQQQQQQTQEMLKFVRKTDMDPTVNTQIGGRLTSEQNRQLQGLISELRTMKEANQRLSDDNQELRDLCCFLDDDRQKGRKLAREWQRFGRYTASVMRQEVSAYQNKLRQLDDKQQELIRDNLELKELCLYLDEERAHVAANTLCVNCGNVSCPPRDDGDGSSSSTNADELMRNFDRQITDHNLRSTLSDQTLQYVRSLERRIHQLEDEKASVTNGNSNDAISGRPEAVVRALQVLEVREQLERDRIGENLPPSNNVGIRNEQMDDGEKALVREMCNVVWRKLEESPNGPNSDPL